MYLDPPHILLKKIVIYSLNIIVDKVHLNRIQFFLQNKWSFITFLFICVHISFIGCKQKDNRNNKARYEMLDGIESQMFQQPESLDSLLAAVDTTNTTSYEQARIRTIQGLIDFNNEEYGKSIKELEQSETFFLSLGDHYHNHINKLIKAFTFEYLNLDNHAASLYIECEDYFNKNHQDKFKFYASLGLFRMAKQLKLDEKAIIDRLKKAAVQFNNPNYNGLLYATMGVFETNDSLKSIYYEKAKSELICVHRWSRVYAIELNLLFLKIRQEHSENTQKYYDNFSNIAYGYTPTIHEQMRYKYGQAYLYSKQGKNTQSIEVANHVLNEAVALNVAKVESDCVLLLANLYKRVSDFKNAHTMLERYHSLQKKNLDVLQRNQMIALGAHYRYSELEKEKLELKIQVQQSFLIICAISLILIVMFSIGWFSVKNSKYKQEILKLKNLEIEDQISNLLVSLKNKENRNENLIIQVEEMKVQHNDSLRISEFLQAIDQNRITTWMEYEACFQTLRPGWIEKLKQAVPELTATWLLSFWIIKFISLPLLGSEIYTYQGLP